MRTRFKTLFALPISAVLVCAAPASAASILTDWSFETQGAASTTSFCTMTGAGGTGPCVAGAWSGENTSGIQNSANTEWPGILTPYGSYYGYVQQTAVLQQSFAATVSGMYTLSWIDAGRKYWGDQSYRVDILSGSVPVSNSATPLYSLYSGAVTSNQSWVQRSVTPFALSSGSTYTLRVTGLSVADNTVFLDGFNLDVPEPRSWALMMAGLFMVAFAQRRARSARASAKSAIG